MRGPPGPHPEFGLVQRNAPGEEIAAVAVAVAERDAEHSWRHQGAIHRDDRERDRQAIIGAQSRDGNSMRHGVVGHGSDLRGMEIGSRTRITEVFTFRLLIAIILMEVEVGAAPVAAGHVAVPVGRLAASAAPAKALNRFGSFCSVKRCSRTACRRAASRLQALNRAPRSPRTRRRSCARNHGADTRARRLIMSGLPGRTMRHAVKGKFFWKFQFLASSMKALVSLPPPA